MRPVQRIGTLPEKDKAKAYADAEKEDVLPTIGLLIDIARPYWYQASRKDKHKAIAEAAVSLVQPEKIGPFPLIYADPPWKFEVYSEKGLERTPAVVRIKGLLTIGVFGGVMQTSPHTPRKDKRPTLTFKGEEFTVEFRNLINKAAQRQGMTQTKWVAEILTREAQRVITGAPPDTPTLPVADDQRLAAVEAGIAELRAALAGMQAAPRKWWWQRAAV